MIDYASGTVNRLVSIGAKRRQKNRFLQIRRRVIYVVCTAESVFAFEENSVFKNF
jgi:hypothetical protein